MSSPRAAEVDEPELELSLEQVAATLHTGTRSPRSTSPVSQSTKQAALIVLAWAEAVQEYNNVAPNVAGYWHLLTAVRELPTLSARIDWCNARKVTVSNALPKVQRRHGSCGIPDNRDK